MVIFSHKYAAYISIHVLYSPLHSHHSRIYCLTNLKWVSAKITSHIWMIVTVEENVIKPQTNRPSLPLNIITSSPFPDNLTLL